MSASQDHAFATIAPIELPLIFRPLGPLPGVSGVREQTGEWDHVGATRVLEFSDGSEAFERLTSFEAPTHFAYRLDGLTGPFRHLVDHISGAWWFYDQGEQSTVRWTYNFQPKLGAATLTRAIMSPLWPAYAKRSLDRAAAEVERTSQPARALA